MLAGHTQAVFFPHPIGSRLAVGRLLRRLAWLTLLAGLMDARLAGQSLAIVNSGFEDVSVGQAYNEFTFGAPNGWQLYDPGNVTGGGTGGSYYVGTLAPFQTAPGVYAFFQDGAPEGSRVAIAFNYAGSGDTGAYGLQQTLSATLQANTAYTLQVGVGNIGSGTALDGHEFDISGFPGYRVDLLAGGVVLASDNNSLAGSISDGLFGTSTVSFITGASPDQLGQSLGIRLVNLNLTAGVGPGADLEVDFDNVRLSTSAIPEPSAALWLGLVSVGLAYFCRQRAVRSRGFEAAVLAPERAQPARKWPCP